ncbi:hypothetical protein M1N79_03810 [Dehalococcoidia bacterium]|nr:hypothetical protein [Dehalococcoidia bacterium]
MVTELLRPNRGGFLRLIFLGIFIRDYLLGMGPFESEIIDPDIGVPTTDIFTSYKDALFREYATQHVGNEQADRIERGEEPFTEEEWQERWLIYLERIPQRLTRMRSHSFYRYFHHLKQLKWVELTGEEEPSFQGGIVTPEPWAEPGAVIMKIDEIVPGRGTTLTDVPKPRRLFRLTAKGKAATEDEWRDPLQALHNYPLWRRQGRPPPENWTPPS